MTNKAIITLLLLTNLALAGTAVHFARNQGANPPPSKPAAATEADANSTSNAATRSVRQKAANSVAATNLSAQKFDWRSVESADYKEYIANLRAIGCPEETIRDIINADVNKLFESRRKALKAGKKFEFWKTGNLLSGVIDEEKIKQNQELTSEKKGLLKELLGANTEEKPDLAALTNPMQGMLDFLPEEKQGKIIGILQDYQTKAMKLMKNGTPDAEDMKSMGKMQKEMDQQMAAVLTPEEHEDYQLRLSQTSMIMRMQLGAFDPSEQEFRDIFKVRKAFEDQYGLAGTGAVNKEERDSMNAAKKDSEAQIKALLGDTRYAEYTRAQDPTYQSLVKIANRNELDPSVATQAYDMDKLSKDEIAKLRANKTMDAAQRDEAIKGIKDESQRSIQAVLGDKAFAAYTNRAGKF
jgi:hypothetical protein